MAKLKQEVPQGAKKGWAAIWTPFVRMYHALFASLRPQSVHAKSRAKVVAAAVKPVARKTGKTTSKQVASKAKPSTKAKPAAAGKKPAAKKTARNRKSTPQGADAP